MATPQNKPKRPTLQINTAQASTSKFTSARKMATVDPRDPTAFNTLSNVYATIIDRKTSIQPDPVTAIYTHQPSHGQAHTPHMSHGPTLPDTPLTAHPKSPMNNPELVFPSAMTATPPLSAGPVEGNAPTFSFTPADMSKKLTLNTNVPTPAKPDTPRTPQRSRPPPAITTPPSNPPYTHPRALHSILRNSPLPPSTARTTASPRRQSVRLQQRAGKRVGYNTPLTQTIVNSKYVFSHVDLLAEDASASPRSPAVPEADMPAEPEASSTDDDTRDGGMTPGPLEDMRRKMAGLGTSSPLTESGGVKKRRRKERKRQWTWTINTDEDPDDEVGGAIAAMRAAAARVKTAACEGKPPTADEASLFLQPAVYVPDSTPGLCSQDSGTESLDVEMSDSSSLLSENSSRAATPSGMDLDEITPLGEGARGAWPVVVGSDGFEEEEEGGKGRKDTPVPPDLVVA